ncbi:SsrA-binding protein SmpB [Candidatus Beckwithbacteria bacterium]|nr:SsrA-binding protein SmpB [Candidatus Beckwithbacteria bacterium]
MKIINKKARFDYELLSRIQTGIILSGAEVKSVKLGHISLSESYVRFLEDGLYLINANISAYKFSDNTDYDPIRSRKLLLHKKEMLALQKKMETKNLTMVPTAIYTQKNLIKLEIALARGKKELEKKEQIKRRDLDREKQRLLKNY